MTIRRFDVICLMLCPVMLLPACKLSLENGNVESPAARVEALLDQEKIDMAADVVAGNESFFAASCSDADMKALLGRLAGALDYKYSPLAIEARGAVEAVPWPASRARWSNVKSALAAAREKLDALKAIRLLNNPRYRPEAYSEALSAMNDKEMAIRRDAGETFTAYSLEEGEDFFTVYPLDLDASSFFEENSTVLKSAMADMSVGREVGFFENLWKEAAGVGTGEIGRTVFWFLVFGPRCRGHAADLGCLSENQGCWVEFAIHPRRQNWFFAGY